MNWADIIIVIILVFSFLGGAKDGAVKSLFSLAALIIAIPCAGLTYHFITPLLSFLPGTNWENFLGFFIAMGIISAILHLIFLLPGKLIGGILGKGILLRLLGGILTVLGAGISLAIFTLVIRAYPIFDWLERWVSSSGILTWLVNTFSFVPALLPGALENASRLVAIITGA